ncbi:hypothetical protein R1X32_11900 [Rhodococcus opacus]
MTSYGESFLARKGLELGCNALCRAAGLRPHHDPGFSSPPLG